MPVNVENFRIADFQQALDHVADDQNVVLKENGFEAKGKAGAFFAGKTARRNAAEALYHAVKAQYGDTVADTLAPQLRDSMVKGKPLSARTVRTVLADAQEFRQALRDANSAAVRAFAEGNRAQGDTRNIDAALHDFGVPEVDQPAMKEAILHRLSERALESTHILSFAELRELSSAVTFEAVQDMPALFQTMQDVHADRLSAQHGLDAGQAAQMRQLVQLAAAEARNAAHGQIPLTPSEICRAASRGELPGQQALLFAFGKVDHPDAGVRDAMLLTTEASRIDMAFLCGLSQKGGGISLSVRLLEVLPEMRRMQPEGPLSRETQWQACFGEALPADEAGKDTFHFYQDMIIKLENSFAALKPGDPIAGFNGMMYLSNGLSTEKCMQSVMGPVALDMGDFITQPSLYALSRLPDMPAIEKQIAGDIHRRGTHNSIQGFSPVISFGAPGQPVQSVHIRDTSGLTEAQKADFREGKPTPISASLVQHCRDICGGNELQARVLAIGLTQAGTMATRTLSPATGEFNSEHAPHHMDVRRQDDGSVTLRIYTPGSSMLTADYTYTIQPNGENRLTDFHMHGLHNDQRFLAMPEQSRLALLHALENASPDEAAVLRGDFFGTPPAGFDMQNGLDAFAESIIRGDAGFLTQTQQQKVGEDGIHASFTLDTARRNIHSFTTAGERVDVPPIAEEGEEGMHGEEVAAFCTDRLVRMLGQEHRNILPFVSMMTSQAGLDCAMSFLPHMAGLSDRGNMHLMMANIQPAFDVSEHQVDVILDGDRLTIRTEFSQGFREMERLMDQDTPPALILRGRVSMVIDLAAPPTEHEVDGKVVLMPQFTLENGDVHFETPAF
ncbi:hypothetical protein [Mailhella sp.]